MHILNKTTGLTTFMCGTNEFCGLCLVSVQTQTPACRVGPPELTASWMQRSLAARGGHGCERATVPQVACTNPIKGFSTN